MSVFLRASWLACGLLAIGVFAQVVPGEYIVELAGDPVSPAAPVKFPRSTAARATVRAAQARVQTLLERNNVEVIGSVETVLNALIVRTDNASALAATPGIARVYPVRLYKALMDHAVVLQKITAAGALIGGSENAGAGIRIGILDTGIDNTHPAFSDSAFQMPEGFPRVNKDTDLQYTNNKVIVARNYDKAESSTARDVKGHGTSVAAVAAAVQNIGPSASFAGVAPKAFLGNYKVFPDSQKTAPNSAILQALNDAVNDGMDIVNLSLGSFPAERPENDPVARAVENATRAGVVVVVAAGNEGPGLATIGSPATAASAISVGASVNERIFAASVWLDGVDPVVGIPSSASGAASAVRGAVIDVSTLDPTGLLCSEAPVGSLAGAVVFIKRGECTFEQKLNFAEAAGAIAAIVATHADQPSAGTMTVGTARLPAMMISYADGLRATERLRSGPAEAQLDFSKRPVPVSSANLATFTSKGPSAGLGLKPELLAVGTSVYTAKPTTTSGTAAYAAVDGTSFSSPMIAGAAALLKAFRPGLSSEDYKSLLVNSTSAFLSQEGASFPLQQTGAGLLDMSAAVQATLTAAPASVSFGVAGSTTDLAQRVVLKNVGGNADTFALSVSSLNGGPAPTVTPDIINLPAGETAAVTIRWSATGLTPGAYEGFVVARGTRNDVATRIPYWYATAGAPPASIAVFEAAESGRPASRQSFLVRALDVNGVPVMTEPKVTVISEALGTTVIRVQSDDEEYPGFYRVQVRLGAEKGANVFDVEIGDTKARVTITGS